MKVESKKTFLYFWKTACVATEKKFPKYSFILTFLNIGFASSNTLKSQAKKNHRKKVLLDST